MKRISEYAAEVESAIRDLKIEDRKPESLYAPIAYAMEAGGKRLRPALTLMAAEAFGVPVEKSMPAALAMEFFHNFTLLHDDVMDDSAMRRNRESVYKKFGKDAAILSGDTMEGIAQELLLSVDNPNLIAALNVYNRMAREVYEGQALDMEFENRNDVSPAEYLEMVRLKTGALLGACAEIGGILAGVDKKVLKGLRQYGENLGIAFQIEDDWLDTFGDAATFGKPIGGDINNGKKTFLLVSALSSGSQDAKALEVAMGLEAGEMRVKTVTRIYEKMEIGALARKEAERFSTKAMHSIKSTGLDEEHLENFKYLLDRLAGRRK